MVKHGGSSVMIWGAISHRGLDPLVVLNGCGTGEVYVSILANHFHPVVQTVFPDKRPVFKMIMPPFTPVELSETGFMNTTMI